MNADGPLSVEELLWCWAFGIVFATAGVLGIEILKTAWQIVRRATKQVEL